MTIGPFTDEVVGYALATQKKWRIPASLALAAAMQESSLGKATPPGSNNWFGIKAVGGRPSTAASTGEQAADGTKFTIVAGFEVFPNVAAGFDRWGQIIGLVSAYRPAVTAYLKSRGTPADVQALTKAIAAHYATALNYATALIAIQDRYSLYSLNLEPSMTDAAAAVPPVVATMPAPPASAPRPAAPPPTVSQSIRVDWGSFVAQLLEHEEPILAAAASGGIQLALSNVPMGGFISMFIGPQVISQYISQGMTALEGILNDQSITIDKSNLLASTVANLFVTNEPKLADFLGSTVEPMIAALIAKLHLS